MTIKYKSVKEFKEMISQKEISNKEIIQEVFNLIDDNKGLNAFITLNEENSIKKAEYFDNNPSELSLAGIPIAQKDLFCTKGLRTTCASNILNNFVQHFQINYFTSPNILLYFHLLIISIISHLQNNHF